MVFFVECNGEEMDERKVTAMHCDAGVWQIYISKLEIRLHRLHLVPLEHGVAFCAHSSAYRTPHVFIGCKVQYMLVCINKDGEILIFYHDATIWFDGKDGEEHAGKVAPPGVVLRRN